MSAKVEIKTKGVRGGEFSAIKETAQAVVFVDDSIFISVDSFEGQGKTYKRREKAEIYIGLKNGNWIGTAEELDVILSVYNKFGKP